MLVVGEMVCVIGKAEVNGSDGIKIIADEVIPMAQTRSRFANAVAVNVQLDSVPENAIEKTYELFKGNQGELQCIFRVYNENRELTGRWVSRRHMVTPSNALLDGLTEIYGRTNVKLVGS